MQGAAQFMMLRLEVLLECGWNSDGRAVKGYREHNVRIVQSRAVKHEQTWALIQMLAVTPGMMSAHCQLAQVSPYHKLGKMILMNHSPESARDIPGGYQRGLEGRFSIMSSLNASRRRGTMG